MKVNAHASLKRVASLYPYETRDGSPSLKTEVEQLSCALRELLQRKVEVCGVKVVSFELSDLSYAAEVVGAGRRTGPCPCPGYKFARRHIL